MKTITSKIARIGALAVLLAALITSVASALAGHSVPWRGSAVGSVVSIVPTPEGLLEFTIHASGQSTQLGHFDRVEHLTFNPVTGEVTGEILFVAANNDTLHVAVAGAFDGTTAIGTYTIDNGTGRFAGASGGAPFVAVTPDGMAMSVAFDGTISTVGG
jgi:hypothetical protein